MNVCTIVAKNYLAHARVLAESFKAHHPDGRCFVLVVDATEGYVDPEKEPFELVKPDVLDIDDYGHMAGIYDVVELSTAVKPWFLSYLMNDMGLDHVAYFDPDIRIFDRLGRIEKLTTEHELVLIPHITSPMPRDGKKPSEADILIAGTYNLGFISLKNCPRSHKLLNWWSERLRHDCVVAPEMGYFVDQRWIDFVHGVMPGFYVLNDPGYNVAYWNLHGREVTRKKDRYYVNGEPLQFFHFSGYDPRHPQRLSKHQSRIELRDGSALRRVCDEYAEALFANGFHEVKDWSYTYGRLPNGVKLDTMMHRLYRQATEAGEFEESIFTREGARRFVAWLNEPAPVGEEFGVTRYLYEIYSNRQDLREAFPNLDGPDAPAFVEWTRVHGDVDLSVSHHPASEENGWRRPGSRTGVNVAGYFRSELGVGEVARQMISALNTQEIPHATVGISTPHSRQGHDFETDTVEPAYPINLICVNADALPDFANTAGARLFENRYSIGMWWWEVNEFPERSKAAFEHLDEVWVGSHHVGDAIASVSPLPVVKVTMPVLMPEIKDFTREQLGLPEDFLFLFVFDYHSVFGRKNPLATVEAFKKAFPEGSRASLVIKSINGDKHPEEHERLLKAVEDHSKIHVIDEYVSVHEKNAMIANCDCYVSLHRSEGFGITLAEAMYLEKPVIATAYSGNMDFMTDRNGYLVDYTLTPIGEGSDPYPPTGEWAEPDLEHAATLMRRVFEDREEARRRAKRAASDIRRTHSPEAAGRVISRRLEHIESRLGRQRAERPEQPAPQTTGLNIEPLVHRIGMTPSMPPATSAPGKALAPARRVLLKLMWPFSNQQRTINSQLLTMIKGVDDTLRWSVKRFEVAQAKVLGAINKHSEDLEKIEKNLGKIEKNLGKIEKSNSDMLGAINKERQERQATPYMAGDLFEVFEDEKAGRVQGYSRNGNMENVGVYAAFEDIFRGSEEFIRERQKRYLPILDGHEPVLDAGCGRGELLDLLREKGIEYYGVDLDPDMIERCRRKGHENVEVADINSYLEKLEDGSLGAIFCAQVIEHLPYEELLRFFQLGHRKLKPEGLFIVETVNPHSVPAMKTFWVDLTHQQPVFPEVALALSKITGFENAYVFHPNGQGDVEKDRYETGEYAVVAQKASKNAGEEKLSGPGSRNAQN